MTSPRLRFALALMITFIVGITSCGYHAAGRGTRLPSTLHAIAIPAFVNKAQQYKIEQVMTRAVVREFLVRTKYQILNQEEPDADATLKGTITSMQISPATFDTATGRASSVLVVIGMRVSLVDRKGNVLFENPAYTFREQYQITEDISTFFEEESPAIGRVSQRFAQTLVSDILEAF